MGQLVDRDAEHLRMLMWAHYIWAGTIAFFSLFALFYIGLGAMIMSGTFPQSQGSGDERFPALLFMIIGSVFLVVGLVSALLTYLAGRWIRERRRRIFCLVMAGLNCLSVPFGTALGVFTIIVLNRPEVKLLFEGAPPPPVPAST